MCRAGTLHYWRGTYWRNSLSLPTTRAISCAQRSTTYGHWFSGIKTTDGLKEERDREGTILVLGDLWGILAELHTTLHINKLIFCKQMLTVYRNFRRICKAWSSILRTTEYSYSKEYCISNKVREGSLYKYRMFLQFFWALLPTLDYSEFTQPQSADNLSPVSAWGWRTAVGHGGGSPFPTGSPQHITHCWIIHGK